MELEPKQIVAEILLPLLEKFCAPGDKAVNYRLPEELKREIDFSLPEQVASIDWRQIERILEKTIEFTPCARHPFLFNYLYSKPDPIGVLGDWIVSLINTNVHTFEASPVFSLAEIELVRNLATVVGFDENADGIFCPGGSYSNMMGLYLARKRCLEDDDTAKKELVVFTSTQAHYSIDKAAILLGIGKENIRKVNCDNKGRMQVNLLRRHIEHCLAEGKQPMCICATSGTTVLGAFDPLDKISESLSEYGRIWLHVDAAWGGAVLMSARHRPLMKGVENADSVTWDFHKALNAPILCSALLVKSAGAMESMFDVHESYLFHDCEQLHRYDLGHKTAQCGRRGDAFKFWLMWKARGRSYFQRRVDNSFDVTSKAIEILKERNAFWLYDDDPDFWNVCFYFVPEHLRHKKGIEACSSSEREELSRITENLYNALNKDGRVLANYARIDDGPAFIRLVFGNPDLDVEQIRSVIDIIESTGRLL
ncbi:MAG: pyridoxal phosphate-dependent decarboxylase family protein [Planctomycetota bacterium]|jgi:glutamate/tyrosine decarboxylase-like PLP-dependent enzyme